MLMIIMLLIMMYLDVNALIIYWLTFSIIESKKMGLQILIAGLLSLLLMCYCESSTSGNSDVAPTALYNGHDRSVTIEGGGYACYSFDAYSKYAMALEGSSFTAFVSLACATNDEVTVFDERCTSCTNYEFGIEPTFTGCVCMENLNFGSTTFSYSITENDCLGDQVDSVGDRYCDDPSIYDSDYNYNTYECLYDGGDCCASSCNESKNDDDGPHFCSKFNCIDPAYSTLSADDDDATQLFHPIWWWWLWWGSYSSLSFRWHPSLLLL